MSGTYTSLYYHLVFSTKNRQNLLTSEVTPRIYDYIGGIIREINGIPIILGGHTEHTHILCSLANTIAISESLRIIKAGSSKWIHQTIPSMKDFAWQEGYGAFSISVTGLDRVKGYILNQHEHHQTQTFQEEFLEFLHRHNIPYDPRYIWE